MDQQPALIEAGSKLFAGIAAAALLLGGIAGAANDAGGPSGTGLAGRLAATQGEHPDGAHADASHGDEAHGPGGQDGHGDDGHGDAEHAVDGGEGHGSADHEGAGHDEVAAPAGGGAHADGAHADAAGTSHGEAHLAAGPGGAAHDGDEHGDDGHGHGDAGHDDGAHDAGAAGAHADHGAGCADDHPATVALATEVRTALDSTYKDVVALAALGYHPYFDALPGGWPPGGEGISHWLNPNYIDDGTVMDPQRPEAVLLDDWNRPLGMMFINDAGVAPVPVYVNDDGTACSPWHPHTDLPARFGWYYYRAMYDREVEGSIPEQTPEMMHVWAVPNPAGVYAAHDYPPKESRQGPPGPLPSYFSDGILAETLARVFASVRS